MILLLLYSVISLSHMQITLLGPRLTYAFLSSTLKSSISFGWNPQAFPFKQIDCSIVFNKKVAFLLYLCLGKNRAVISDYFYCNIIFDFQYNKCFKKMHPHQVVNHKKLKPNCILQSGFYRCCTIWSKAMYRSSHLLFGQSEFCQPVVYSLNSSVSGVQVFRRV